MGSGLAVSGGGAQATPGLDNDAVRALDRAEQLAEKAGDSFVMKPGFTGVWRTIETVRKIYLTVTPKN